MKVLKIISTVFCSILSFASVLGSIVGPIVGMPEMLGAYIPTFVIFTGLIIWMWVKKTKKKPFVQPTSEETEDLAPYEVEKTSKEAAPIIYVEKDNVIVRADGQPITDQEIPHLIEVGYAKPVEHRQNSPNPKFHRTEHEKELSFRFIEKYSSQVAELEQAFETAYHNAYNRTNIDEKIEQLENTIRLYEKAKNFCYSKGKGGTLYFDDMWEHLHNSQHPDSSYITNACEQLENFKDIKMVVIPQILKFAKDGFLQKDIYNKLDCDFSKSEVRKIIDCLVLDNLLIKEKRGNSYFIKLK